MLLLATNLNPGQIDQIFKAVELLLGSGILASVIGLVFKAGVLVHTVSSVKTAIDTEIKPELKSIRNDINGGTKDIADIKSKVDILWQDRLSNSNSPRVLNARGKEILESSGIKKIVDDDFDSILAAVKAKNPSNAYQAERLVIEVVSEHCLQGESKNLVQNGAYSTGSTIDEVLFVGALYIRDKVLESLGMLPEDIDKHVPKAN